MNSAARLEFRAAGNVRDSLNFSTPFASRLEWFTTGGESVLEIFGGIFVLSIMVLFSGIRVVKEHERLVVYRLGKIIGSKGQGVQFIVPLVDNVEVFDTRLVTSPIPALQERTADDRAVVISVLCMVQITDAAKALSRVDDPVKATIETAQAVIRVVVGQQTLDQLFSQRRIVNAALKVELECRTRNWGVRIKSMEIKEVKVQQEVGREFACIAEETLHDDSNAIQLVEDGIAASNELDGGYHSFASVGYSNYDRLYVVDDFQHAKTGSLPFFEEDREVTRD